MRFERNDGTEQVAALPLLQRFPRFRGIREALMEYLPSGFRIGNRLDPI